MRVLRHGSVVAPPWSLLSALVATIDQGSGSAVAPIDPDPIGVAGTGYDATTGRATIVCGPHVVGRVGYREPNILRWSVPIVSLWPDYDPERDRVDIGLKFVLFAPATNGLGLFAGLVDRAYADVVNMNGVCFSIRQQNGTNHQTGNMGETSVTGTASVGLPDELRASLAGYPVAGPAWGLSGFSRVQIGGLDLYATNAGASPALQSDAAAHRLTWGGTHIATTDLAGKNAIFDVYVRRCRTAGRPFS